MNTAAMKLRVLTDPMAEAMADGERLTSFVKVGVDAANEIDRLHTLVGVIIRENAPECDNDKCTDPTCIYWRTVKNALAAA